MNDMKYHTFPINNVFLKRYESLGCPCTKKISLRPILRINTLKMPENKILERISRLNVRLEKSVNAKHGYFYDAKFSLGATTDYLNGYYYIQELASQLPVQVLNPAPGETVLDMAASPGSKTTQLAQWMGNSGRIIALDVDNRRLSELRNNLERCNARNVIVMKKDARFASDLNILFDKILLDAPCSGNYAIEEDFFLKKSVDGVKERARLQRELLKSAVNVLKQGGVMVYSTCSLEPEEDEFNIDWLLKKYPQMHLEDTGLDIGDPGLNNAFGHELNPEIRKCRRLWPEKTGTEGFFIAKFSRN